MTTEELVAEVKKNKEKYHLHRTPEYKQKVGLEMMKLHHQGQSLATIAKQYGVTRQRVHQLIHEFVDKS
jgi:DNA-directed RNA polymerase sigma subunit (sigma70/sigma32)